MKKECTGKVKMVESENAIKFLIPSDKNWFRVVVFTPAILIWIFVAFYLIPKFVFLGPAFFFKSLVWICGWTLGGLFAIRMWLWHIYGYTSVILKDKIVTVRRRNDIFSRPKHFDASK